MKRTIQFIVTFGVVTIGFIMIGCVYSIPVTNTSVPTALSTRTLTTDPAEIFGVPWAEYTYLPSKDYTVIGTVVLRDVNQRTVMYDLMEQVIAMKGHDIINVRMAVTQNGDITAATAVVIQYTDETINPDEEGIFVSDLSGVNFFLMGYGGTSSVKPNEIVRAPWSGQNIFFPSKNYVVVGTVGLGETNSATVLADLMEQSIAMGGHDVMNVRLGIITEEGEMTGTRTRTDSIGNLISETYTYIEYDREVNVATAVAIRYTDENIRFIGNRPTFEADSQVGLLINGTKDIASQAVQIQQIEATPKKVWPWVVGGIAVVGGIGGIIFLLSNNTTRARR